MLMIFSIDIDLQFTRTNLDDSQKEGNNFLNLFQKEEYPERERGRKGVVPQKRRVVSTLEETMIKVLFLVRQDGTFIIGEKSIKCRFFLNFYEKFSAFDICLGNFQLPRRFPSNLGIFLICLGTKISKKNLIKYAYISYLFFAQLNFFDFLSNYLKKS